ncbi:FAD-linked oxidase C-terminal domain-containing protein, partial [Herbaspirillum sp. B65]|uniref:FAD-linked oxidase C-terminal domain-containing protein n=1 Tax=Herbaspirillum sp. B65 TaxID=137708 RepID=UPI0005C7FE33
TPIEDWGMSGARNINVRAGNVDVHSAGGNDTITVFGLWRAKVRDAGGNNTLDVRGSGLGALKREEILRYKSPVELRLMRAIKAALDPQQLMNPGKVL